MAPLGSILGLGVDWDVRLARTDLLPGRVAEGQLDVTPHDSLETRGLVVALVATEQWQYRQTTTGPNGTTTTHTVTERHELVREPVQLLEAATLPGGVRRTFDLQLPVPPLGPATFEGTVTRLTWELEAKLDMPGLDPSTSLPVRVLQPTALLRAGVIDLPAFALYPSADAAGDGLTATIALDPVPLCAGGPLRGTVNLDVADPVSVRGVRVAVVANAKATVASGLSERLVLWEATVAGASQLGGSSSISFDGQLRGPEGRLLPTSELPHGRSDVVLEVTLDRPWAPDAHVRRDVAVCTTTEL